MSPALLGRAGTDTLGDVARPSRMADDATGVVVPDADPELDGVLGGDGTTTPATTEDGVATVVDVVEGDEAAVVVVDEDVVDAEDGTGTLWQCTQCRHTLQWPSRLASTARSFSAGPSRIFICWRRCSSVRSGSADPSIRWSRNA